jgi:2-haloacid dehalogenase
MLTGSKPEWLTFDCYGTLIQWDEGLMSAVEAILVKQRSNAVDVKTLISTYDRYEHRFEQQRPHESFRMVAGKALLFAMDELALSYTPSDAEILTSRISQMPPFPEVVGALGELKAQGFKLCIISNADDDVIAGNVAQLGGHIDRVVTAQQAQAYKPSSLIFEYAHKQLGIDREGHVHICASPHLDLVAARDMKLRSIWIDRGTGRKPLPDYSPNEVCATLDRVPSLFRSFEWSLTKHLQGIPIAAEGNAHGAHSKNATAVLLSGGARAENSGANNELAVRSWRTP